MLLTDTVGLGGLIAASSNPIANAAIFLAGSALTFEPFAVAIALGCLVLDYQN